LAERFFDVNEQSSLQNFTANKYKAARISSNAPQHFR